MTVKELQDKLKEFDPRISICVYSEGNNWGIKDVREFSTAEDMKKIETRDIIIEI